MSTPDLSTFLGGLTLEQAAKLLVENKLELAFPPAKTLGDKLARVLYVQAMNEELERTGALIRITPVPATKAEPEAPTS